MMEFQDLERISLIITGMSDPSVSNSTRIQAYQACDDVKKSLSPQAKTELGYVLAKNAESRWSLPVVRFGLQLLEETIKLHWPSMSAELKLTIKNMTADIIKTLKPSESQFLILDSAAKLLVEILKREWPQQYPDMLPEVEAICSQGPVQMQTIILVFLRFVEDLVQFRSLPPTRQRDITEALKNVMPEFVSFLVRCLDQSPSPATSIMIVRVCLALGEFAQIKYLWENNGILFDILLSRIINVDNMDVQLEVASFLNVLLTRRYSKKGEVVTVLQLLTNQNYFVALVNVLERTKTNGEVSLLFRKLCEVFSAMAAQVVQLVDVELFVKENLANFRQLLEVLRMLTDHQNPLVSSIVLSGWLPLWGNRHSRVDENVQAYATFLLRKCCIFAMLHKIGDSIFVAKECAYQEEQFREFLRGYRMKIVELIRRIAAVLPKGSLEYGLDVLRTLIMQQETNENAWGAVLTVLDGASRGLTLELKMQYSAQAAELVNRLIEMDMSKTGDFKAPGITSLRLSLVSRIMIAFFSNAAVEDESLALDAVDKSLNHILYIMNSTVPDGVGRDENREELHFHARNLFTTFTRSLSRLLVLRYDSLVVTIRNLFDTCKLTTEDRMILLDGLITIIKDCPDAQKKSQLCAEIINAVTPFWMTSQLKNAIDSAGNFFTFCGLDKPLFSVTKDPEILQRRSQIMFCSHVIATTFSYMKFSGPEAMVLVENAFLIIRCFMQFHLREFVSVISAESQNILSFPESEAESLLKSVFVTVPQPSNNPNHVAVRRTQNWLRSVFESVCRIVGYAGHCFGADFYKLPDLVVLMDNSFLLSVATGIIPLYRVRVVVKELMANFIRYCPADCVSSVLIPVLRSFCPAVSGLLNSAWSAWNADSDEKTEILTCEVIRAFTKDYANLILQRILCDKLNCDTEGDGEPLQDEERMDDESDAEDNSPGKPAKHAKSDESAAELSALGTMCMQDSVLANAILSTVFNGLWWPNSALSVQFIRYAQLLIPKLTQKDRALDSEAAKYIMYCLLSAFRNHGQDDATQAALITLGLQVYFHLRPLYPTEVESLLKSGDVDMEKQDAALKNLDNQLYNKPDVKHLHAKSRRDAFKRVIVDHVGKPISTLQKLEVFIPNPGISGKKKS